MSLVVEPTPGKWGIMGSWKRKAQFRVARESVEQSDFINIAAIGKFIISCYLPKSIKSHLNGSYIF
jgi:hypothetical protein